VTIWIWRTDCSQGYSCGACRTGGNEGAGRIPQGESRPAKLADA
jgi:hypothetical protein